jgi:hypothetical protein
VPVTKSDSGQSGHFLMKKRHFYTENVAISPQKVVAFRRFLAKNALIKNHKKRPLKNFSKKVCMLKI